jgi:hypothetical protein
MTSENFPKHPSLCLFGKRRTGKTFSLRWIMYNCFRHIPFGICCSQTAMNGFWQTYIPSQYVYKDLDFGKMQTLIDRQDGLIKKWKKDHPEEDAADSEAYKAVPELAAFIILDDVISDRGAMQWSEQLLKFFVNGRHYCITVFITSQHVKGIGPMIRGNMDMVVLQPIFQKEARDTLAELYAGWMGKKKFLRLMSEVVFDENQLGSTPQEPKKIVRTMCINDFENTTNPQLKFHWSMAEKPPDKPKWRLLHDDYWKEQDNNIGNAHDLPHGNFDPCEELEEANMLQNWRF